MRMVIQQDVASRLQSVFFALPETAMTTASSGTPGKRKPRPAVTRATARAVDAKSVPASQPIQPERRHAMICDVAYFLSERRGFSPGHELDDWLTAEAEVDRALTLGIPANRQGG
jgi:hypothetical protein